MVLLVRTLSSVARSNVVLAQNVVVIWLAKVVLCYAIVVSTSFVVSLALYEYFVPKEF